MSLNQTTNTNFLITIDCQNFVSQSLHAVHIPFFNVWFPYTYAWKNVDGAVGYFVNNDIYQLIYHGNGTDYIPSAFIGMVGYIDFNRNGEPDYGVVITSVSGGRVKYSAHTRNVKNASFPKNYDGWIYDVVY